MVSRTSLTSRRVISGYRSCGVSSYDGTDDQVQDRHLPLSERNFKAADFITTEVISRRDEYMVTNMMSGNLEMQHQARNSSSISSEKQHYAMKSNNWHQDQWLDPTRRGRPFRSRMRLETDEHLSKVPFYSRRYQADHGNGSPSSYRQNEFQCRSSFHSPDKHKYPEQEKMELLRMVYELEGQLHRTSISKGNENGRFAAGVNWKEKQIPSYYDRVAPDVEMFHDLNYLRHPGRCSQGKIWSQRCKVSHIPFSGEAAAASRFSPLWNGGAIGWVHYLFKGTRVFTSKQTSYNSAYPRCKIEPPRSEINEHSDAISRRGSASTSHANYCPHADPVSFSDDYGLSLCRSCSTEGEPYSLTPPLHILERNNDRNMSSGSSFEPMEEIREKKPVLKQSQNNKKNPVGTFESLGPPPSRMSRPQKLLNCH
ncbi:hypothetical protein F0562_031399 [Nyssa sinensis]|uniref:Uncharacterized protein n=1 Tax=Nyssa sinensis TaxID=561372 RepID=A0A5J5AVT3_9ASTE|nr:hypothetical protein F0562_031399 [Nyssa sinensis]